MANKKKHVFELTESTTRRRSAAESSDLHRLLVRVLAPINETLRQKAMYRGDLSDMVVKALESVDLISDPLVAMKWGQEEFRGLTIQIPIKTRDKLVAASKKRRVSINTLINSALVHWLAKQGDVRIKDKTGEKG
jgi:hypothetical protein